MKDSCAFFSIDSEIVVCSAREVRYQQFVLHKCEVLVFMKPFGGSYITAISVVLL